MTEIVVLHYPGERARNWALLCAAAAPRGVQLVSWAPHLLGFWCADGQQQVCYAGEAVRPGILLHRTVAPFRGIVVPALDHLATAGTVVLNSAEAAYRSRDKLLTTLALAGAGVPVVPTFAFDEPGAMPLAELGPGPLVCKPAHGVRGEGVAAYASAADLAAASAPRGRTPVLPGYYPQREHYLAQPLVGGGGQDIRAYVVHGRCVALIRRTARPGEIRANLELGARATPLPVDHPGAGIAVAALAACGLDLGGVDLIEDSDGVLRVLEVDAWAGFAGITEATGADVAGAILDFALDAADAPDAAGGRR